MAGSGGGGHPSVVEADIGKLQRLWQDYGGILPLTSSGDYPREDFGSEPVGVNRGREEGYLQGFLPSSIEFGGLSGVGVPREVPHNGKAPGTLHVYTLEESNGNCTGGDGPFTTLPNMFHAHAHSEVNQATEDRHV